MGSHYRVSAPPIFSPFWWGLGCSLGVRDFDPWPFVSASASGDGTVTLDEFIDGVMRCKGPARAIDQVATHAEIKQLDKKLSKDWKFTKACIWFLVGLVVGC